MATINKKSLETVFAEFKKASTVAKEHKGRYPYYPFHAYMGRMIEVLGTEHFRPEYSEIQHVSLSTGQSVMYCTCKVSFIDDEGKVCYVVQGIGSFELTFSSEKGTFIMLDNSGLRLQQQAFKSVCKELQFFDEKEDEEPAAPTQPSNTTTSSDNKPKPEARNEVFYTSGEFIVVREDERTHKPIYKVYGNRVVGNRMETSSSAVLFYPNMYKSHTEQLNNMIALCRDGKQHKLSVSVTSASYKEDDAAQYVFRSFVK